MIQVACKGKLQMKGGNPGLHDICLNHGDVLIIVDVQKDFLAGGSLEVEGGDEIIEPLNRYLAMFVARNLPIVASGDFHPPTHCSFKRQGGPWPPHCVSNTEGAQFAEDLALPDSAIMIHKGTTQDHDAYSAFDGTELNARLGQSRIHRVFLGGLATDYCVLHTTVDALKLGYETHLLKDAVRAVNVHPDDGERAEALMVEAGASRLKLEDLIHAPQH